MSAVFILIGSILFVLILTSAKHIEIYAQYGLKLHINQGKKQAQSDRQMCHYNYKIIYIYDHINGSRDGDAA